MAGVEACVDPTHLLSLPLEIRLEIYALCLINDTPIVVHFVNTKVLHQRQHLAHMKDINPPPSISTNLLIACRQIYFEASTVLYGRNTFILEDHRDRLMGGERGIEEFLARLSPANCSFIRDITLHWVMHPKLFSWQRDRTRVGSVIYSIRRVARDFASLRELTVLLPNKDFRDHRDGAFGEDFFCRPEIEEVLKGVRGLRKLTIGNTTAFERLEKLARVMEVEEFEVCWNWAQHYEMFRRAGFTYVGTGFGFGSIDMEMWTQFKNKYTGKGWVIEEWNNRMSKKVLGAVGA